VSIKITEQAAKQIEKSAQESGMQGLPLRVAAKRGATGEIEYAMGFDEPTEMDHTSEQHGVQVVVAPMSADLLSGAMLDYVEIESGEDHQFIFLNPNDPNFVPPEKEQPAGDK
jgi:iron-sulfur cluster assembly protein